ncbi:MAG: glutathione S-transferase family protein [Myxococcota bacterium]
MDPTEFEALVVGANAEIERPYQDIAAPGGPTPSARPRFELYHAAPSLCSHKVRFALAEKGLPFRSHALRIVPAGRAIPHNYRPGYVRLRLAGAPGSNYVSGFTGRSSVDTEGFDPAVVPTLVDHEATRVIVDSALICDYLDREAGTGPALRPASASDAIDEQIAIVDRAPHVALLYGANPAGDHRPGLIARAIRGVHARKEVALRRAMEKLSDDDTDLRAAYESKIAKERAAARFVASPTSMGTIVGQMQEGVEALERSLEKHGGDWACGGELTLADIAWGPSLFRMRWIGIGHLFAPDGACPRVAAYAERLFARPAFRAMVVEWPGAHTPSRHVPEMNTLGFKARAIWHVLRHGP